MELNPEDSIEAQLGRVVANFAQQMSSRAIAENLALSKDPNASPMHLEEAQNRVKRFAAFTQDDWEVMLDAYIRKQEELPTNKVERKVSVEESTQ